MAQLPDEPCRDRATVAGIPETSGLSAGEQQYRGIFAAVGEALLIFTLDGQLVECNPAAQHMYGYTAQELCAIQAEHLLHPDSRPLFASFGDTIRGGQEFRARGLNLRKDGTTFPAEVLGTPFLYQGRPHILAVVRDISDEVALLRRLEGRVEERTRQLAALLEISRNVAATLDLPRLLDLILDQLSQVVDYSAAALLALEGDAFRVQAARGPFTQQEVLGIAFPLTNPADRLIFSTRRPVIVGDLRRESPISQSLTASLARRSDNPLAYVRAWMGVPLVVKEQVIGMLSLEHRTPDYFTPARVELVTAFANQAAVAIENARLFAAEQRRAEQFRVIGELGQRITSILDANDLVSQTVHLIRDAFGYDYVHLGLVQDGEVRFAASAGTLENDVCCRDIPIRVGLDGISGRVAGSGQPIIVADVSSDPQAIPVQIAQAGSALVVPLKVQDRVLGVLDVESERPNAFDQSDLAVLQSLADQVAVAVENARLYEQARQLASLEERQKLARELHDSVSQALYGIALGARTARVLLDREPALADGRHLLAEPLDYTLSLADAALAEMRALIFELRPESLQQEGLVVALTKQADSLRTRYRLDVECNLGEEPGLALEAKEALYRIAQEALHNVVKHARARRVWLELAQMEGQVRLRVCDNGIGFAPRASFPGHLGLQSMRERATRLGGTLEIESTPEHGTCVRAWLPMLPGAG